MVAVVDIRFNLKKSKMLCKDVDIRLIFYPRMCSLDLHSVNLKVPHVVISEGQRESLVGKVPHIPVKP